MSPEEQQRADQFRFASDRIRFIVAHAALREILSSYLAVDPTQIQFIQNAFGKPALAHHPHLRFNMAHADACILIAVAHGREVGVDAEGHRPALDYEALARRILSAREWEVFRTLPASERPVAFLRCWTQKEALLKARGAGLAARFDSFEVNPAAGGPAELVATRPDPQEATRWSLFDVPVMDGCVAALAVEGRGITLRFRRWPPGREDGTA